MLSDPGVPNRGGGRTPLSHAKRMADRGSMPIMPGGFDEDTPQMRIAGFGNAALVTAGAAGVFRGDRPGEAHEPAGARKARRIADFSRDGQRRQIVDTAEAPQAEHALTQWLEGETSSYSTRW